MDANFDIKSYRERWKAIEEIGRWQLIDSQKNYGLLKRLLICFGVVQDRDVESMQIILRWAKLKDIYERQSLKQSK